MRDTVSSKGMRLLLLPVNRWIRIQGNCARGVFSGDPLPQPGVSQAVPYRVWLKSTTQIPGQRKRLARAPAGRQLQNLVCRD